MAIGATCVFEFRTTGSNDNGGGYTSGGTDYTLQDAAELTLTDLACLDTTTNLTSTTGGFTAAMVGNIVYIKSGTNFVAGWYEIASYTDGNTVVIDRTAATGGNDASAGTGSVGGARALPTDDFFEALTAGNLVYMKAGTYTLTESIWVDKDGSAGAPIILEGYNSSRGDNPTGTDRPLIAGGSRDWVFDKYWSFLNLRLTTTDDTGWNCGVAGKMVNISSNNSSGTAGRRAISMNSYFGNFIGLDVQCANGHGIYVANQGNLFLGCYIHDCDDNGIYLNANANGCQFFSNVFDTITLDGLDAGNTEGLAIVNNTFYNCGKGIDATAGYGLGVFNNIIDACGIGASATANYKANIWDYNCWDNTVDTSNVTWGDNRVEGDPGMTNPAAGDFSIGSGSNCSDVALDAGDKTAATV